MGTLPVRAWLRRLLGQASPGYGFCLLSISLVAVAAYSNIFEVPFQWDENVFIKNNPLVKDMGHFLDPATLIGLDFCNLLSRRFVGYLTFALNYRLHGLDVTGYHVLNLGVHVLNGLILFFLVTHTLRAPYFAGSPLQARSRQIALLASLVFVSHPVQTEAVTYIFQRFVSIAALFYMLCILFYLTWRLRAEAAGRFGAMPAALYLCSLASAVLAMKTKENAFTVPFAIVLYEVMFFGGGRIQLRRRALWLLPMLLTLLIIPLSLVGLHVGPAGLAGAMSSAISGYEDVSRLEYFITQYRVAITYMRLLVFPVNQCANYDYPVFSSFLDPEVIGSFMVFASLQALALFLALRSRKGGRHLRLLAFGIMWFFLTLSVESTIVPIPMVINEYRLYLPSAGIFMAGAAVLITIQGRFRGSSAVVWTVMLALPLSFASATYMRNQVWQCEVRFWEDVTAKSPGDPLGYNHLGLAYREKGYYERAIGSFKRALALDPLYASAHNNLALAYCSVEGMQDMAVEHYEKALSLKPGLYASYNNLGIIYFERGVLGEAIKNYRKAIELRPEFAEAHNNLALAYRELGLVHRAENHLKTALRLSPDYERAHYNLGLIYLDNGIVEEAHNSFEAALSINPDYENARDALDYIQNLDGTMQHPSTFD